MGEYVVCLVTIENPDKAAEMARILVERQVVACVNIIPKIRSIYFWNGQVVDDTEVLMLAKTRGDLFEAFKTLVRELHHYEVPEIIAVPMVQGLTEYLEWINDCTQKSK